MPHTYSNLLTHAVFSTKDRLRTITEPMRNDLHAYLGGIIRELGGTTVIVGGIEDHVHLLLALPTELPIAECLRVVKGSSAKWVHEKWPERRTFGWQRGYAAFSVSASNAAAVSEYIRNQVEHHRKRSFEDEFKALLRRHGIGFEDRFLWS